MKNGVAFSLLHSSVRNSRSAGAKVNFIQPVSLITCSILAASLLPLSAQTPAEVNPKPTTEAPRIVDYSPAINELLKLGFPDIRNAKGIKYVKVNDNQLQWNTRGFSFGSDQYAPKGLTGNGFLIPNEDPKKASRFIYLGGFEMQHLTSNKKSIFAGNSYNNGSNNITKGKATDADIKKDLQVATKWVKDFALSDNYKYSHNQPYTAALGYASVAHQAGHKEEANALIKALILNHQNPEQMIDTLINLLAETEYLESYNDFQITTDWKAYHKDLLRLQKKFPRGWKNQPALTILIPQVDSQINNVVVIEPKIKGHDFSPEIQKLLKQTANPPKKSNSQYYDSQLFLIKKSERSTSAPPFIQLTQLGMDGFIAIASLIGDDTLVPPSRNNFNNHHYSHSSFGYYDDEETTPEQAYASIQKPQTLGSIAHNFISANLPHDYQTLSELDPEGCKNLAIEWWQEHRHDDRIDLIKHYMAMGNQNHTRSLINSLSQENTEESIQLLESSILSSDTPSNFSNSVQQYVMARKTKANDFLTKYEAAVMKEIELNGKDSINYQFREETQLELFFSNLRGFTEEQDPKKLLVQLEKDNTKLAQTIQLLVNTHEGKHISTYINPIIKITANKEELEHQSQILTNLYEAVTRPVNTARTSSGKTKKRSFLSSLLSGHKRSQGKEAASSTTFTLSEDQKADWEKLINSDEYLHQYSISHLASSLLDISAHPTISNRNYKDLQYLGMPKAEQIIKARAEAILAGSEILPLPNADDVTNERLSSMLKILEQTEAVKLRDAFNAFSQSERIALNKDNRIHQISTKAETLILAFEEITTHNEIENTDAFKIKLKDVIGKEASPATYHQIISTISKDPDTFSKISLHVSGSYTVPGKQISFYESSLEITPEVKEVQKQLLDGTIKTFTAVYAYDDDSGDENTIIITPEMKADSANIISIADYDEVAFTLVTKETLLKKLEEDKKNGGSRENLIKQIIKLNPMFADFAEDLEDMSDEELREVADQFKKLKNP